MAALEVAASTVGDEGGVDSMEVAAVYHGETFHGQTPESPATMDTDGDAKARTSPTTISEIPPFQPPTTSAELVPEAPDPAAATGTPADAAATALLSLSSVPLGDAPEASEANLPPHNSFRPQAHYSGVSMPGQGGARPHLREIRWTELQNVALLKHGSGTTLFTAWLPHSYHPQTSAVGSNGAGLVPVVVKCPKQGLFPLEVSAVTQELQREAEVLHRLSHPNIIRFYGCGVVNLESHAPEQPSDGSGGGGAGSSGVMQVQSTFFIVVERLDKGTLAEVLAHQGAQARLAYMDVLRYAEGLANALHYIHHVAVPDAIVIHRDLKPDNIGFGEDGVLKLFDFGLCTRIPRGPLSHQPQLPRYKLTGQTGSVRYMAPEVALDQPYNQKVDVFGFSLVIWEILHRRKPFSTMNVETHRRAVCIDGARPPIDRALPHGMSMLLQECWSASPDLRPNFADITGRLQVMLRSAEAVGAEQYQRAPVHPINGQGPGSLRNRLFWFNQAQQQQQQPVEQQQQQQQFQLHHLQQAEASNSTWF